MSRLIKMCLSIALFMTVWAVIAWNVQSLYLPSPIKVFDALIEALKEGQMPFHIAMTLMRVAISFFLAMVIGSSIGIIMGRLKSVDDFFDSWLILFLNLPALVTMILCYIWFGLNEVAAILAVAINKIPNIAVILREGARAIRKDLQDMALVYELNLLARLRHIILPQLNPYFAAAARSGLALVWKIVLVVELLGRSNGVGFQLHLYFQLFDVASIIAYAIAFIIIIEIIELLLLGPWQKRSQKWIS